MCVAFHPHGNRLASGSYDESVKVWQVDEGMQPIYGGSHKRLGRCLFTLPAHSDAVASLDFSYDGTMLASGGFDGLVRIWNTATGQCLKTLRKEECVPVSQVRFTPNAKFVVVSSMDSRVRLWDYVDSHTVKTYIGHVNQKYACALDICVRYAGEALPATVPIGVGPRSEAVSIANSPDASRSTSPTSAKTTLATSMAASTTDKTLSYSRTYNGCIKHRGTPLSVNIVAGSENGNVYVWDMQSKKLIQILKGHTGAVVVAM